MRRLGKNLIKPGEEAQKKSFLHHCLDHSRSVACAVAGLKTCHQSLLSLKCITGAISFEQIRGGDHGENLEGVALDDKIDEEV